MLCLDLDGFKGVNDTLGHPVGDALLRKIGDILLELAPDGLVSRLGGDEFAIILSGGFDDDRPRALAQAIIDAIAEPMRGRRPPDRRPGSASASRSAPTTGAMPTSC